MAFYREANSYMTLKFHFLHNHSIYLHELCKNHQQENLSYVNIQRDIPQ